MAQKLTIRAAVYTSVLDATPSGEKGRDVTAELSKMVDEETQTITFPKGTSFNALFGDPEPFHPKQLKVLYTLGGVDYRPVKYLEAMKHKERCIPDPKAVPLSSTEPESEPQLGIVSATWGAPPKTADVTEQVANMIRSNALVITPELNLCSVLGDPAMGKSKELVIVYKIGEEEYPAVTISEKKRTGDVVIGSPTE